MEYEAYSFSTVNPATATVSISKKIDISSVHFSWATNVQGAYLDFYSGTTLVKTISWGPKGTVNVTANNIDRIVMRETGDSRDGTGDLQKITYVESVAANPATVSTTSPTNITASSATVGGNVTADGGAFVTERGLVYSTSNTTPTTANAKLQVGSGTGSFSTTLGSLTSNTTYYVRAYAINAGGTSYGSVQSFTTHTPNTLPQHTIAFNGTNQYITVANKSALNFATGTVEMWVKPDWAPGTKGGNPCLISMRDGNTRYSIHMENNLSAIGIWNTNNYLTVPYSFSRGQWYHVAAVMKASSTDFYVNGTYIGSTTNTINQAYTTYDLKIGNSMLGSHSEYFKGEMDEVRVWNTVRSSSDINANYGNPVNPSSSGLVAYYMIEQGVTGPGNAVDRRVIDHTSNAFNGTLINYFSSNANLSALSFSGATLTPGFSTNTTTYTSSVPNSTSSITVTPTLADSRSTVTVNGMYVSSGNPSSPIALNVGDNSITVLVTAETGDTKTYAVTVTREVPALSASITSQTNIACYGGTTGKATVTATGGTAPYTYSWSPYGGTAATATNLSAGQYTVTVSDVNGRTTTATTVITQPDALVLSAASQTNVSCNLGSNGAAQVAVSGGTGPYTYIWSNGATTQAITSVAAGNYTVTVSDANECSAQLTFTITQPSPLQVSVSTTKATTSGGGSNGSATATATGGSGGYTYLWSNGADKQTATGLQPGNYRVYITDANSCTLQEDVTIELTDDTAPTLLSLIRQAPTDKPVSNAAQVYFQATFSESVKNVDASDFTISGTTGTITSVVSSQSSTVYSLLVSGGDVATLEGVLTVALSAGNDVKDLADNSLTYAAASASITLDHTAPQVSGVTQSGLYNSPVSITFNEGTATLNSASFTSGSQVSQDGAYTLVVTDEAGNATQIQFALDTKAPVVTGVADQGWYNENLTISFNEGTATLNGQPFSNGAIVSAEGEYDLVVKDDAGNATSVHFGIDKTAPVVTGVAANGFYNTEVTISFNEGIALLNKVAISTGTKVQAEGVYGLKVTDRAGNETSLQFTIDTTAPVISGVADNGFYNSARTITFDEGTAILNGAAFTSGSSVSAEGNYSLSVTDAAGNATSLSFVIDMTKPTGSLAINGGNAYTNSTDVALRIVAQDNAGIDETMRLANVGGAAGVWEPLQSTKQWQLMAGDGEKTVTLELRDKAGNTTTIQSKIILDTQRPTVVVTSQSPNPVNAAFGIGITFSEDVAGFEASDLSVANGTVSDFMQIDARRFTAMVSPTADGEVTVSVAADAARDAATNGNQASNVLKRIYDTTRPTLQLASAAPDPVNTAFEVSFTFSEPVSGFEAADIAVSNGAASQFTQVDAASYTALITPTADGQVSVSVAADAARDAATNGNEAAQGLTRTYDATRPEVTVTTTAPNPTNAAIAVTVEFSEGVTGFDVSDLSVSNGAAADFVAVGAAKYTAVVTPAADGEVTIAVTANVAADAATNGNTASNTIALTYDATAPAGYAVAFDQARVDVTNVTNASVSVTGAEVGTTYAFSIQSSNGGTPVTGTGTVSAQAFQLTTLDLTGLNDGTLTVSLTLTDAASNQGAAATAQVVKITRNIVSVATPATMQVPIRTAFGNIGLPAQVEVTYSTGEKGNVGVTWLEGNYNGLVDGPYALTGELTLAPMTTNIDGRKAGITVEVQPNKAPTALALSKSTFKPNTTAADAIGEFATTDADDPAAPLFEEHVYTLVSGQGDADNGLFEIRGKELHLISNHGLSGQVSFTIRVRSTDPYQNTIEKSFTLQKTAYEVPKEDVKVVNAFSPNGDGFNDNWTIPELRFYNDVYIQVFDRSGVRVFETTDPETGWDGRAANGQLLKGPYLYIVEVKDINWVKRGVVTILSK